MGNGSVKLNGPPDEPKSIWNRSFIILFFANMAFNMGLNMSNSILSIYADSLGASAAVIGFIVSAFAITSVFLRLISAPIMDTFNRKHLIIIAALMMSCAFGGFSISNSIPLLICFRLLQGCSMAFGNACCLAMVADMLPKENYNSGLGYYSLAQVACSAIAPYIGLELVKMTGYRSTFVLAACFMLFAGVLIFFIKTDFVRSKKLKLSLNNIIAREALLPAVLMFLMVFAGTSVMAFLYLFAAERGITGNVGLYFTVSAVTMLVTRPIVGRLTDKFGLIKVSVPAFLCSILSMFIISYSTSLFGLLFAALISAFGQGACSPAIQALAMKTVSADRRGSASSTNYIAQDLGAMAGSSAAGQIIRLTGYAAMWRIMVIPYIAGAAALLFFRRRIARIEDDFSAQ